MDKYFLDGPGITILWSRIKTLVADTVKPYTSNPSMNGTASAGSSGLYSRGDHVHPKDTSKQDKITASGLLKGNGSGGVSAATAGTDYAAPDIIYPSRMDGYLYENLAVSYIGGAGANYWKITLPERITATWTMLLMEVSIRQRWDVGAGGEGGKLLINAFHNTEGIWSINATAVGRLRQDTEVYGSDGRVFWIKTGASYTTISVDRVLIGDSASLVDIRGTTIEAADALPPTYQTALMFFYQGKITASGILKGNGSGVITAAVAGVDYQAPIANLGVAMGGTGAASFTANSVIMSGSSTTAALTTRAVTNNTSATALAANTNIPTNNTVYYGVNHRLNRSDAVNAANTSYGTYMARGIALATSVATPANGCLLGVYS